MGIDEYFMGMCRGWALRVSRWSLWLGIWAVASLLVSSKVQASVLPELNRLDAPEVEWSDPSHVTVSGTALHVKAFRSSLTPAQIAESLGARSDLFQRVLWRPGGMLMSGLAAGWHWLAQINAAASGSEGHVSAMRLAGAGLGDSASVATQAPALPRWLPAGSAPRFRVDGTPPDGTAQEIYHVPLAPPALGAYVEQALRREGWQTDSGVNPEGSASSWRKGATRLQWFAVAAGQGSHLYVHVRR